MDVKEAREILNQRFQELKARSYNDLCKLLATRNIEVFEILGPSAARYQLEAYAAWDDRAHRNLRVWVTIDDGGWRAFVPLTDSFSLSPEGKIVGE